MSRIAVTGAAGPVGRRVCALLAADPAVKEIRAVDRRRMPPLDGVGDPADRTKLEVHRVHLRDGDLDAVLDGVDTLCHLAGSDPLEGTAVDHDLHTTGRLLDAAARCSVGHIVVRSSATVYGAWPDNPVPLTEAADLRPNGESPWVQMRARIEARVQDHAVAHPEVTVAILRPCVTVSPAGPDELGRVLAAARVVAPPEGAAAAQFVHADDVAAAVDVVRRAGADGVFNVAPDGALDADWMRALVGGAPRLPLPSWLGRRIATVGWRYQLAPTPPGFLPFATDPWIVANDRLRALGWDPTHTNDEAYVVGHDAAPWAQISPQRRQELALGIAGAVLLAAGGAGFAALRGRLRSR